MDILLHYGIVSFIKITIFAQYIVKRSLTTLILFIYLLTSSGLFLSVHYCSGDLEDVALYEHAGCACGDPADMPEDCCETSHTFVKINDVHQSSKVISSEVKTIRPLFALAHKAVQFFQTPFVAFFPKPTEGPPLTFSSELNIINCVYRL